MVTKENIDRFLETWNKITRVFAAMECFREDPGLTKLELLALSAICNREELIMRQLAEHLGVSMSTATVVIDKLVEKGLVGRERNHGDRRVVKVKLTEKGEKIAVSFQRQKAGIIKQVMGLLSQEEQENFILILEKISGALNGDKRK
ncbi:MAG: hypothetical protein A7316_07885 [Candidatus Altiarchaeales archaeon WOR_SM1_86-2]|nr:MAG: hypothetical protein A7316_07885 [Candidatus Altiarchaeales archaeon WOR_SM1_86-2]ODS39964.1 MAG: hypothetical protein A7315_02795 [Candidatus Altiarchaeales archaeon WOR_SM1_79]